MNSISFRLVSFLFSLAALTVVGNTMSARAETPSTDSSLENSEHAAAAVRNLELAATPLATAEPLAIDATWAVEPSEPAAAAVWEVEPAVTPVATVEPQAIPSSSSVEGSNPASAKVWKVGPVVTPVATVEPQAIPSSSAVEPDEPATAAVQAIEPAVIPVSTVEPLAINPTFTQIPEEIAGQTNVQQAQLTDSNNSQADSQRLQPEANKNDQQSSSKEADATLVGKPPIPGTLGTSAAFLTAPLQTSTLPKLSSDQTDSTVAQTEIDPGQATRGGRSYIGIAGNIGFGDTGLGSGAFVINSKIGLTSTISVRPSILLGDNVNFLLPITYDFTLKSEDPFSPLAFAPFGGGGLILSTADNNNIGFMLTGGVDVPLSREFVANASLNIGFLEDSTDVGIIVGVGYTFPNFLR